ncbi:hypothetical protein [Mycolicibacterium arenosum]|uniref:Uncharacterized protein n=1 Tax=Mycolicibacterium arenosum TaxID=2952157 RepID=A0ABT1LZ66_9MYCO|nr:hypothetical protein [Mycolicibacterium sp. CAU 1645]MCP9272193.1 hypothetical protein [Mycolicibacterium sp. CAU 1645]
MGRHSIAYIDAQQGLSARPAAAFVGRVGALALALGIGAAVAGGPGIARADETGGAGGAGAQTSSSPSTGDDTATAPTGADSPTASTTSEDHEPGAPTVPTMQLGTAPAEEAGENDPAALPESIPNLPEKASATKDSDAPVVSGKRARESTPPTAEPDTDATTDDTAGTYARMLSDTADAVRHVAAPTTAPTPPAPGARLTSASVSDLAAAAPVAPAPPQLVFVNPVVTLVSGLLSALGFPPSASTPDGTPTAPMPIILGVLQLVRREIENITLQLTWPLTTTTGLTNATPATSATIPDPSDEADTAYGDIGKWMLKPDGRIADYGGEPYGGKTLLEAVNIVIVDPTSTSPAQAASKLDTAMFWSGFPAQPIHTGGFEGTIDEITYGQLPNLPLFGYSNNLFVFPNDHGRIFGPDPVETAGGYVWSGAFSTEQFGIVHGFLPGHTYVSSNTARNALAMRLILSGRATYGGMVPLDNAYTTATTTTGDHDGYAVVLILK